MNFEDYETLPTNDVATHMMAGAIAGVMEHCVMYPLDSVKTRMQSLSPSPNAAYRGVGEALVRMVKQEGVLRPVRGMSAVVMGAGPAHALYFSCYEMLKKNLTSRFSHYNHLAYGASGCIATLLHDGIMTPSEVVKQRLQMYNSPYNSCLDCIRKLYRTEGLQAFYRSYTTQLTMNIPFQSIHFMMYEFMQNITNSERTYNPKAHMISGAIAGAVAAAVTTPLDVCKTLLNTQEAEALHHTQEARVSGMLHAIRTVYRVGGFKGYFQGLQARVLYQMPSTAICWSMYEFFKYVLSQRHTIKELEPMYETPIIAEPIITRGVVGTGTGEKLRGEPVLRSSWEETRSPVDAWGIGSPAKSREIPVTSATGLYGALSFTTVHENKTSLLDITTIPHS